MAQPTGSTNLNQTWVDKGLKTGAYITANGAFAFDNSTSAVAVTGTYVPGPTTTEVSSPFGDVRMLDDLAGGAGRGYVVRGANGGYTSALADSMTFIMDITPSFGNGNSSAFYSAGNSTEGAVGVSHNYVDATTSSISLSVLGYAYGPERKATLNLQGATHRRVAFRYVRGQPIQIFVNGVLTPPTSSIDTHVGATPKPTINETVFFNSIGYGMGVGGSHMLIFNTALSDADIQSLQTDPWQVFAAGAAPTGTVTISNVTKTTNSATVTYGYSGGDATGYQYRLNGGPATTLGASPETITGLVASTNYTVEVRAINGNGSGAWSTAYSFTTNSPVVASLTMSPIKNNAGTLLANESGVTVIVNTLAGVHVVTKTGQTSNASGVITVQDAAMTAGTTYRALIVLSSGAEGLAKVVAA